MKAMKKVLSFLLVLSLMMGCMSFGVFAESEEPEAEEQDYKYSLSYWLYNSETGDRIAAEEMSETMYTESTVPAGYKDCIWLPKKILPTDYYESKGLGPDSDQYGYNADVVGFDPKTVFTYTIIYIDEDGKTVLGYEHSDNLIINPNFPEAGIWNKTELSFDDYRLCSDRFMMIAEMIAADNEQNEENGNENNNTNNDVNEGVTETVTTGAAIDVGEDKNDDKTGSQDNKKKEPAEPIEGLERSGEQLSPDFQKYTEAHEAEESDGPVEAVEQIGTLELNSNEYVTAEPVDPSGLNRFPVGDIKDGSELDPVNSQKTEEETEEESDEETVDLIAMVHKCKEFRIDYVVDGETVYTAESSTMFTGAPECEGYENYEWTPSALTYGDYTFYLTEDFALTATSVPWPVTGGKETAILEGEKNYKRDQNMENEEEQAKKKGDNWTPAEANAGSISDKNWDVAEYEFPGWDRIVVVTAYNYLYSSHCYAVATVTGTKPEPAHGGSTGKGRTTKEPEEIVEEEVPLAEAPEEVIEPVAAEAPEVPEVPEVVIAPAPAEEMEEMLEEDVPLADVPATDGTNNALYMFGMLASLLIAAFTLSARKER